VRLLEKISIWPNNPASETTQHAGLVIVIKLTGKKKTRTSVTRYIGIMLLRNVPGKKHGRLERLAGKKHVIFN
jgi:hypothetical protein